MAFKIDLFGLVLKVNERRLIAVPPHVGRHLSWFFAPIAGWVRPHVTFDRRRGRIWLRRFRPNTLLAELHAAGQELVARWRARFTPTTLAELSAEGWELAWFEDDDLQRMLESLRDRDGTIRVTEAKLEGLADVAYLVPCSVLETEESPRGLHGLVRERDGHVEMRWLIDGRKHDGTWFTVPSDIAAFDEFDTVLREHAPTLFALFEGAARALRPKR